MSAVHSHSRSKARSTRIASLVSTFTELSLQAVLLVTAGCTGLALLSKIESSWLLEIFSHFWFQYGLTFVVLAIIQWNRQRRIQAALSSLCVLLFVPLFLSIIPTHIWVKHSQRYLSTRVFFANVLFENTDYSRLIQQIHQTHPDVVILAEIPDHLDAQMQQEFPDLPYHYLSTHSFVAFQLAIYSRISFSKPPEQFFVEGVDEPGLEAQITTFNNQPLRLIGIHPSPPFSEFWSMNRDRFMYGLADHIRQDQVPTLLVGDFNNTPTSASFQRFLDKSGLKDSRAGWGWQGSWPSFFPTLLRIPIDHGLASPDLKISTRIIEGQNGSDHLPVVFDVVVPANP